jgi:hypothetical protein
MFQTTHKGRETKTMGQAIFPHHVAIYSFFYNKLFSHVNSQLLATSPNTAKKAERDESSCSAKDFCLRLMLKFQCTGAFLVVFLSC